LKTLVQSYLKRVLVFLRPDAEFDDESDDRDDQDSLNLKRIESQENQLHQLEQAKRDLELTLREAEERAALAAERLSEREQALQRLKDELRRLQSAGDESSSEIDSLKSKIAALEKEVQALQERLEAEDQGDKSKSLQDQLRRMTAASEADAANAAEALRRKALDADSIDEMRKKAVADAALIDELRRKCHTLETRVAELERRLKIKDESESELKGASAAPVDDGEMNELRAKLKAAHEAAEAARSRVSALEIELGVMGDELSKAAARAADAEARFEAAVNATTSLPPPTSDVQEERKPTKVVYKDRDDGGDSDEIARLNGLLVKARAAAAQLREEKADLDQNYLKALEMIRKLKKQLEKLLTSAEGDDAYKLVKELLTESGLKGTWESGEFNVFDRLYDDAMRRYMKYRSSLAAQPGATQLAVQSLKAFSSEGNRDIHAREIHFDGPSHGVDRHGTNDRHGAYSRQRSPPLSLDGNGSSVVGHGSWTNPAQTMVSHLSHLDCKLPVDGDRAGAMRLQQHGPPPVGGATPLSQRPSSSPAAGPCSRMRQRLAAEASGPDGRRTAPMLKSSPMAKDHNNLLAVFSAEGDTGRSLGRSRSASGPRVFAAPHPSAIGSRPRSGLSATWRPRPRSSAAGRGLHADGSAIELRGLQCRAAA
jgi:hypothetical protein